MENKTVEMVVKDLHLADNRKKKNHNNNSVNKIQPYKYYTHVTILLITLSSRHSHIPN